MESYEGLGVYVAQRPEFHVALALDETGNLQGGWVPACRLIGHHALRRQDLYG